MKQGFGVGKIIIGISSWADSSLVKSEFYPQEIKTPEGRLRYYASQFSLTESDASYHAIPFARSVRNWIEGTPPGFVFDLKAFSLFSGHPTLLSALPRDLRESARPALRKGEHLYISHLPEAAAAALWQRFASAISPLDQAGKLGFVMFQYPPWFHPNSQNSEYVRQCRANLSKYRLAVEFRTPDWFDEEHLQSTLDLLRSENITLVCVDEPQGLKTSIPPVVATTSRYAVIRFHGRNRAAWEQRESDTSQKYDYLYSDQELADWLPGIRKLESTSSELHIIFKNKHLDHPAVNARQMQKLLAS